MHILFTADWHLKLGQRNVPVKWARSRYLNFFELIHKEKCDLHIIGGDLFDKLPTIEELDLYYSFVEGVQTPTVIFSGNHEATKKNKTFFTYLARTTKQINSDVDIVLAPSI